jgi:mannosyl-glycoprotein endo-beta-N-acetylglucosaminidase
MNTSKENTYFPPSSSWLVEGHYIKWSSGSQGSKTVSVKIDWKSKDGTDSQFPKYNIYVEKLPKQAVRNHGVGLGGVQEYLGVANVEAFYVSELPIPATTSSIKFIIQVCGVDGVCQNMDDSPYFQLDVKG